MLYVPGVSGLEPICMSCRCSCCDKNRDCPECPGDTDDGLCREYSCPLEQEGDQ